MQSKIVQIKNCSNSIINVFSESFSYILSQNETLTVKIDTVEAICFKFHSMNSERKSSAIEKQRIGWYVSFKYMSHSEFPFITKINTAELENVDSIIIKERNILITHRLISPKQITECVLEIETPDKKLIASKKLYQSEKDKSRYTYWLSLLNIALIIVSMLYLISAWFLINSAPALFVVISLLYTVFVLPKFYNLLLRLLISISRKCIQTKQNNNGSCYLE